MSSWVTDVGYRGYAIQVLSSVTSYPDVDLLITDTAGAKAEPALRLLRWSRVSTGAWDTSCFWITGYRGIAKAVLQSHSVPLAHVLQYPAAGVLACADWLTGRAGYKPRSSLNVECCCSFDSRFDTFWNQLRILKRDVMLSSRSRAALCWHFSSALRRGEAWVLLMSQDSHPVAYAVFDRQDSVGMGLKRIRLVDFQAIAAEKDAWHAALAWAIRKCRADGIHVLERTGGAMPGSSITQGAPVPRRRRLDAWRYYYRATHEELAQELREVNAWEASPYDGDTSI
jgi:hypothetical protein